LVPAGGQLPSRVRDSLLVRPVLFVSVGLGLAAACLWLDATLGPGTLPAWVRFDPESARILYATLAGALLTVAGITFWVRSATVALAAGQFSANVVMGFLEDWFQQSVMSLMLGLFAYTVAVFRVIRPGDPAGAPDLSVLVGIVLAASSVVFVMGAIRNAVRSMYSGSLGRRISDVTVQRIRTTLPMEEREAPPAPHVDPPSAPSVRVRATASGWIGGIDEATLLTALPAGAVVQLEVRVGLYAIEGRPLAQVWTDGVDEARVEALVREAVTIGRRTVTEDIEFGVQQLVDLAIGSLVGTTADVTSAYEVVQHLELVLWELGRRRLPPRASIDDEGRTLIRARHITYDDYVRLALERLRRTAVTYPTVSGAVIVSASEVARDLDEAGFGRRAAALRRQVELVLDATRRSDIVADDLARLERLATRRGATDAAR
jgi:uncharacterized membrane protein